MTDDRGSLMTTCISEAHGEIFISGVTMAFYSIVNSAIILQIRNNILDHTTEEPFLVCVIDPEIRKLEIFLFSSRPYVSPQPPHLCLHIRFNSSLS